MSKDLTAAEVREKLWKYIKAGNGQPRTQKEVAAEIGVSLPFLNAILHGKREPSGKPEARMTCHTCDDDPKCDTCGAAHGSAKAAALHFRYWPAISTSFDTVAPKLSSVRG